MKNKWRKTILIHGNTTLNGGKERKMKK